MLFTQLIQNWRKKRSSTTLQHYYTIEGWLTLNEANGLFEVANSLKKGSVVVEIGSWKGKSTYCIAQGLKRGIIHCIDPFNAAGEEGSKEVYESEKGEKSLLLQFQHNLRTIPRSVSIEVHKGYSHEFVGKIPFIDFLFIDGDHSIEGCKFDFENFSPYVNVNGFVAFHDYFPERTDLGPTWVINNIVRREMGYKFYKCFDSLQIFRKVI